MKISIHAPRVGSDYLIARLGDKCPISIHAPRVGSDDLRIMNLLDEYEFQSTLPVWGATLDKIEMLEEESISIHAPRVGSDKKNNFIYFLAVISIHAPRVGSDPPTFRVG